MFEAQVAVASFIVWIVLFSSVHFFMGERAAQHRFDGAMPHDPFSWVRPSNWYEAVNPTVSYLASIQLCKAHACRICRGAMAAVLTPSCAALCGCVGCPPQDHFVHAKAPLVEQAPSFGTLAVELACGIVLYDLLFYPLHYLMHHAPFKPLRAVHGYHHRKQHTLNALETVQHSYVDGALQVMVNILVQQITPFGPLGAKHPLSRLLHNMVVTYLLVESHSGYDLPFMTHRLWPAVFGGAPRHESHHHNGRVAYHQFFKYIDDFLGFVPRAAHGAQARIGAQPEPRTLTSSLGLGSSQPGSSM